MSKLLKPGRQTVALGKSRIRRDPVPISQPAKQQVRVHSPELEMWGGVTGIVLFAAAIALLIVGVGIATYSRGISAEEAVRYDQCYNGGQNCVFDGDTIRVDGSKVEIAGLVTPQIQDAGCSAERSKGIHAATTLVDLLNSGKVTVGTPFRDFYGRTASKVTVGNRDVAAAMIADEDGRSPNGDKQDWCD